MIFFNNLLHWLEYRYKEYFGQPPKPYKIEDKKHNKQTEM